ncbi:hypothetical protein [Allofrancisella frigidaquae]|uniref:Uncharacterized protein n=1 Tax=Allofrancisella frigidaquae TaxID=1085644 RepID=A0A6M3HTN9_9GAMM|nr:hypothetical protein [Allofrancisella frigidaquae]QIV94447.1 hypothetical protein E3E15_03365 [Allofrancisella frigidaquae]
MNEIDEIKTQVVSMFDFDELPLSKKISLHIKNILELNGPQLSIESLDIALKTLQDQLISLKNVQPGIEQLRTVASDGVYQNINTICTLFLQEKNKCFFGLSPENQNFEKYPQIYIHYIRILESYFSYVLVTLDLIRDFLFSSKYHNLRSYNEFLRKLTDWKFKQKGILIIELLIIRFKLPEFEFETVQLPAHVCKNIKAINSMYLDEIHHYHQSGSLDDFKLLNPLKLLDPIKPIKCVFYARMLESCFKYIASSSLTLRILPKKTNLLAQKLVYSLGILPQFEHTWQQSVTMYKGMQRYTKYNREAIVMHIDTSGDRYAVNTCMILDPNVDLIMISDYNSYSKLSGYLSFWMGFAKSAFPKLYRNGANSRFTVFIGGSHKSSDEEYSNKREIDSHKKQKTDLEKKINSQKKTYKTLEEKLKQEFYDNHMNEKTFSTVHREEENLVSLENDIQIVSEKLHQYEQESKEEIANRIKSFKSDWDDCNFGDYATIIVSKKGENEKHTYYYQQLSNHQFQNKFHNDIPQNSSSHITSTDLALEQIEKYSSVHNRRITRTVGEAHEMIKKSIDKNGAKYMKDIMTDKLKASLTDTARTAISKYIDTLLQQNQLIQNKGTLVVISRGMNREELTLFRNTEYQKKKITDDVNLFDLCDTSAQGRDNKTGKKNLHHMMCKELKDFYEGLSDTYNIVFMGDPIYHHMGFPSEETKYKFSDKVIDATQIWNKEPFKNDKDGSTMCKQAYFILELQNKTKGVVQTGVRTGMMEYMAYFCVPTVGIEFQRDYDENPGTTGINRLLNIASWIDECEEEGPVATFQKHFKTKNNKFVPWILLGSSIPYGASTKKHPLTHNRKYNGFWREFKANTKELYRYIFDNYMCNIKNKFTIS